MSTTSLLSHAAAALGPPPPIDSRRVALFADLDGTLAPIEARPADVGPDPRRARLLDRLSAVLGGRLAVISGRGLGDLDRVLGGRIPALAAVHGLVRRTAAGAVVGRPPLRLPAGARQALKAFAGQDEKLALEDKGAALALHYRAHPAMGGPCRDLARKLAEDFDLKVQEGNMVVELRAPGPTKADAVAAFMAEAPFAGALPVFIGDDLTDEDGFAAAARLGGYGVIVGARRPTGALYALDGVDAALAWLAGAGAGR